MKAVTIDEGGVVTINEVPKPLLNQPDQVLIKVAYSGLCGSDIARIFAKGAHFYPITLGHEFSGRVVEIGNQVIDLHIDDAVACVPLLPCFECEECQHHYYSLCKNYSFVGSHSHGGNAEYIVVKRSNIFKLPPGVSLLEGAFLEPITVGLHALLLAGSYTERNGYAGKNSCVGKNVTIIGAGTIGLLAMQCAKAMGAASLTVIDINPQKLELAKRLGADNCYNSAELNEEQIRTQMLALRFEQLILETAGTPQTVMLSINIAGSRAQIALIGTLHHDLTLAKDTFGQILRKELTLLGSWMNYSADWPGKEWQLAAEFCQNKVIRLEELIASVSDAEDYVQRINELKDRPLKGKIMLKI